MNLATILVLLRYALSAVGVILVKEGLVADEGTWQTIAGALLALAPPIWGAFFRKALTPTEAAANLPPQPTPTTT